jgi:ribonuclease P protein component
MLPATARLRRKTEFSAAIRSGGRARQSLLSGYLLVRPGDEPARVGFVVSGIVGPAVVRNRVRRQLRHLARRHLPSLPGGSLLVLRANPRAATARQEDLAAELDLVIATLLRRQDRALCR